MGTEITIKGKRTKKGEKMTSGRIFGPRWIIHFPTKKHWRQPSKMEWVDIGVNDLYGWI